MSEKIKYALPGDEQRKEMAVITVCWDEMSRLDSLAHSRVVSWLSAWVRSEMPEDENRHSGF